MGALSFQSLLISELIALNYCKILPANGDGYAADLVTHPREDNEALEPKAEGRGQLEFRNQ